MSDDVNTNVETTASEAPQIDNVPAAPSEPVNATQANIPDISSLLNDPKHRETIFASEHVQRELHKARSDGGRRAKAELDTYLARQHQEAETMRMREMDSEDLGNQVKSQLHEADTQKKYRGMALAEISEDMYRVITGMQDLDDSDRRELHPLNPKFTSFDAYLNAVLDTLGTRRSKKLAASLAKTEAEALVNERLAKERSNVSAPANLPTGATAFNDAEFLDAYAAGKNTDHGRAQKLLSSL